MILVVDTETTGLNRRDDYLLEVGIIACTDDLVEIDAKAVVIQPYTTNWDRRMDDVCRAMHTKNGLIVETITHGFTQSAAQVILCQWLAKVMEGISPVPMTGSTVDFDREFLRRSMPALEAMFHYRSINVSTVKELVKLWAPTFALPPTPEEDKAHRALDDARATIEEMKRYKHLFERAEVMRYAHE